MKVNPRRGAWKGYPESDRDYLENNRAAAVQLLDLLVTGNECMPGTRAGPWMQLDGHGQGRVILGGDPDNVFDRVAFIEKTPRVRIRAGGYLRYPPYGEKDADGLNWAAGFGSGPGPETRAWCDLMLIALGYQLED